MILLIGSDEGLLEGLAQVLARHAAVATATSVGAADDLWRERTPHLIVIERTLLRAETGRLEHVAGRAGMPLVTFRPSGDAAPDSLSPPVARLIVADLELPLERHRLVAIAERLIDRAQASGRLGTVARTEPPFRA